MASVREPPSVGAPSTSSSAPAGHDPDPCSARCFPPFNFFPSSGLNSTDRFGAAVPAAPIQNWKYGRLRRWDKGETLFMTAGGQHSYLAVT